MVGEIFAGINAERALSGMMALGRTWQPAVIVRENLEFSGFLMAEELGVPHAVVQVTAWRLPMQQRAAEALDRLRPGIGLPSDPGMDTMFR